MHGEWPGYGQDSDSNYELPLHCLEGCGIVGVDWVDYAEVYKILLVRIATSWGPTRCVNLQNSVSPGG